MTRNVVLITGASKGIGLAAAQEFARGGWTVAASMRNPSAAPKCLFGANYHRYTLDVTDETSIEAALTQVMNDHGRVDVLVNNAGFAVAGPLEGMSHEQWMHQFDTNLFGMVACIRHTLPIMRSQREGTIVNVSSIGGRLTFPFLSAYHASKFAVEGMSESLRYETSQFGIRVKLIEPGGIRTSFLKSVVTQTHRSYEPNFRRALRLGHIVSLRLPGPQRVARVIYKACTDGSSRFRYTASPGPILILRRIIPDRMWSSAMAAVIALLK